MPLLPELLVHNIKLYYIIVGLIVVWWIGQILRVTKDISSRTESTFFQIVCILIATLGGPVLGLLIYLMIRPSLSWSDMDQYYQSGYGSGQICLTCKAENLESANYCVFCGDSLKVACHQCAYHYYRDYLYCPKCGTAKDDKAPIHIVEDKK